MFLNLAICRFFRTVFHIFKGEFVSFIEYLEETLRCKNLMDFNGNCDKNEN